MKTLSKEQLAANLSFVDDCLRVGGKSPPPYIVAADAVPEIDVVVVVFSDKTVASMDYAWFVENPMAKPDFSNLEIIDQGLTLKMGDYEVGADTLLGEQMATEEDLSGLFKIC